MIIIALWLKSGAINKKGDVSIALTIIIYSNTLIYLCIAYGNKDIPDL